MQKLQPSQMTILYVVIIFLFRSLYASLSSASGNPASLPVIQKDIKPENYEEIISPPMSNDDRNEEIALHAHLQNFLNDTGGDVRKALELASVKGDKDVVLCLLDNHQIDKDDVSSVLTKASSNGHKEIVSRLLKDTRIEPFHIELAFDCAIESEHHEIASALLDDQQTNAETVRKGFNWAITKGNDYIVGQLLKNRQINADELRKYFFNACLSGNLNITRLFLENERIEAKYITKSFLRLSCKKGIDLKVFSLLLGDSRINPATINKALVLAAKSSDSKELVFLLLNDNRIEPEDVNEALIAAAIISLNKGNVSFLLADNRIRPASVNKALVEAAKFNRNKDIVTLFLGDYRIEPAIVNEALIAAAITSLNKGNVSFLLADNRIKPASVNEALVAAVKYSRNKEIITLFLADNRIAPKDVHDAFELDIVNICVVTKHADIFWLYMKGKQNVWSQIIENLGENPIMAESEIARIPILSLHAHNALQMLAETNVTDESAYSNVVALTEKLAVLYHKLGNMSNFPHLERARTSLLLVPYSVFSSLKQILAEFESAEPVQSMLQKFFEQTSSAYTQFEAYFAQFQEFLSKDFEGKEKDALRKFVQLHLRPEMSSNELELAHQMILDDLGSLVSSNLKYHVVATEWIWRAWKSDNRDLFSFVTKTLVDRLESKKVIDELIEIIVARYNNTTELQLHLAGDDVAKVLKFLAQKSADTQHGHYRLTVQTVFFENIQELPLMDETFFGPSFRLISDRNESGLEAQNFQVKYVDDKGVEEKGGADAGGPSRNWIEKMLHAMADPKRHFLRAHGVKKQVVPEIAVDPKVFFGLGRLIGKGILKNAGFPFAFHPKWVRIMREPQNTELIEESFNEFYQDHRRFVDFLLSYVELGAFEDILNFGFSTPCDWQLTTESRVRNFMIIKLLNQIFTAKGKSQGVLQYCAIL